MDNYGNQPRSLKQKSQMGGKKIVGDSLSCYVAMCPSKKGHPSLKMSLGNQR